MHGRALPYLLKRVGDLGFAKKDLHSAFLWIRDAADVVCHVDLSKIAEALASDTHYRNQLETNTSSGMLKHEARRKWERVLFGSAYAEASPFECPKYGVQNVWNDHRGVVGCKQYGDSYLVLQDVRLRCTCTARDSALLPASRVAVLDFCAHALLEYSDNELTELLRVCKDCDELVGDSEKVVDAWGRYKEVQVHGEIDLDRHVSCLVVADRHRNSPVEEVVNRIRRRRRWPVVWMQDERVRLVHGDHRRKNHLYRL